VSQIVPGYSPDESTLQKMLDWTSVPARVAAQPLLQGGEAFQRWMSGEQGPDVRRQITESVLGLAPMGPLTAGEGGVASFPAWHGSRHQFTPTEVSPLGEFQNTAIGTGEGTQIYGSGHYVAQSQGVARSYMTAGADAVVYDPGNLYQVSVKPDEHEFLDWDQPLHKQSPQVQKIIKDNKFLYSSRTGEDYGHEIYAGMVDKAGEPQWASEALHNAGIPGIKYLDQQSRNIHVSPHEGGYGVYKGGGWESTEPYAVSTHKSQAEAETAAEKLRTRSFVVFHPSNLKVIDRNGQHYGFEPVDFDPWAQVPQQ
jgi:hypothetical protein